MSVDGAKQLCDEHLRAAEAHLDAIKALKARRREQLTYDATLGRFDDAALEIEQRRATSRT